MSAGGAGAGNGKASDSLSLRACSVTSSPEKQVSSPSPEAASDDSTSEESGVSPAEVAGSSWMASTPSWAVHRLGFHGSFVAAPFAACSSSLCRSATPECTCGSVPPGAPSFPSSCSSSSSAVTSLSSRSRSVLACGNASVSAAPHPDSAGAASSSGAAAERTFTGASSSGQALAAAAVRTRRSTPRFPTPGSSDKAARVAAADAGILSLLLMLRLKSAAALAELVSCSAGPAQALVRCEALDGVLLSSFRVEA
mmetsp:Transcript_6920/g.19248  ORF Transcript_6920/g.19248 Transcript_6920/m.19248 type:complete len:254 (+) Transcript_6920:1431-2192(+)